MKSTNNSSCKLQNINRVNLKRKEINEIFNRLQKLNPSPKTALNYKNEFQLLIAVMLSAQATDISVNKVTSKLFEFIDAPKKMLQLTEIELREYIRSIGLFRTKAANILKTCHILVEQFNSTVPNNREDLESLPGVGRKTANVLLNTLWQQPTIAVDTHVFRVANRIGLVEAKTPIDTELQLLKIIPKKFIIDAHHWLILHGRSVCKAINPKCNQCLIMDLCRSTKK